MHGFSICSRIFARIGTSVLLGMIGGFLFLSSAQAGENERYRAFPIGAGGYVFILDTREGHIWTWTTAGEGQASPSGGNPRIVYQGKVSQNMSSGKASQVNDGKQASEKRY